MSASSPGFKAAIYEQIARVSKALASSSRLELLDLLSQGPRTVEDLARQTGQTIANASHHLKVLRAAHLVESDKRGLYVTCRLADGVEPFLLQLHALAHARITEIAHVSRQFLERRGALEAVDDDELMRRIRAGGVTLIDVRPREEYLAGHIPGALSLPLPELKARTRHLPKDREIVAYCRGRYCVMALDAIAVLRRRGFRAWRLERGVADWRARGWRVEIGPGSVAAAR